MAADGPGRLCSAFHKGELQLPLALCSKDDLVSRLREIPAKGAPDPPLRHPQCPGILAINYTPERVGVLGLGLPIPVKDGNSEGKRVKTTKPQHRLKSNRAVLDKGV